MRNYFNRVNVNHTIYVKKHKYTKNLAAMKRISRRHARRILNAQTLRECKLAQIESKYDVGSPHFARLK